jgi:hypothetical protein
MAGAEARLLSVAGADGSDISLDDNGGGCFPRDWACIPVMRDLRWSSGLARALHEIGEMQASCRTAGRAEEGLRRD